MLVAHMRHDDCGTWWVTWGVVFDYWPWCLASVLGAGSVLEDLASALRWGPLWGLGIGARYGIHASAWASQRPSYLYLDLLLATSSLLLTSFLILLIKFPCFHPTFIVFLSAIEQSNEVTQAWWDPRRKDHISHQHDFLTLTCYSFSPHNPWPQAGLSRLI